MLQQHEKILTTLCLVFSAIFLTIIIVRIRNIFFKKSARVPIWNKKVGMSNRVGKLAMAISLFLMVPGVIYFIFIISLPTAVMRDYAKMLFCIIFSAWALLEILLCSSISDKLLTGPLFRRILFFAAAIFCIALAVYFFPLMPKSLSYPAETDCVILELPVRGTWLAKHAGASGITNGHHRNHPYAIDILKLGR